MELTVRRAAEAEFAAIRSFYHRLIDLMQDSPYHPAWKKDIYPNNDDLRTALRAGQLYVGMLGDEYAAAMIVNHTCNEGYRDAPWSVDARDDEVTVIHTLGVMPTYGGRGYAKRMVREAIAIARRTGQKAVRLDVLAGNLPAERLYAGLGFRYVQTVRMFYEDTGRTEFMLYEYLL